MRWRLFDDKRKCAYALIPVRSLVSDVMSVSGDDTCVSADESTGNEEATFSDECVGLEAAIDKQFSEIPPETDYIEHVRHAIFLH